MHQSLMRRLDHRIFFLCCVLGLGIRLTLAWTTYGTNDVEAWLQFMKTIRDYDLVQVYSLHHLFNHPPLVGSYLLGLSHLLDGNLAHFPFFLRLPAVLADTGTAWLTYIVASRLWGRERGLWSGCLVALSPVLIMVSGFHGNTDPVFVFISFLAVYQLAFKNRPFLAGCLLGLSMSIKIVPLILCPLFFFGVKGASRKAQVVAGVALLFLMGWGYHFSVAWKPVYRNVFQYNGLVGKWGTSQIIAELGLWRHWLGPIFKAILAVTITAAVWISQRWGRENDRVAEANILGYGLTFFIFLLIAPGFGVQYMSWLVVPTAILSWDLARRYNLLAGIFLFSAYHHWCHGFPWWYAGSVGWNAWEWTISLVTWMSLVAYSVRALKSLGMGRLFHWAVPRQLASDV